MQVALWSLVILIALNSGLGMSQAIANWAGGKENDCNRNTPTLLCETPLESEDHSGVDVPSAIVVVDNNPVGIVLTVMRAVGQLGGLIAKLCTLDYEIINPNSYQGEAAQYMAYIGFVLRVIGVVLSIAIPVGLIASVLGRA